MSNVTAVLVENLSAVNIRHRGSTFLEKGGFNVIFWCCDPEKAHSHADRVFCMRPSCQTANPRKPIEAGSRACMDKKPLIRSRPNFA